MTTPFNIRTLTTHKGTYIHAEDVIRIVRFTEPTTATANELELRRAIAIAKTKHTQ